MFAINQTHEQTFEESYIVWIITAYENNRYTIGKGDWRGKSSYKNRSLTMKKHKFEGTDTTLVFDSLARFVKADILNISKAQSFIALRTLIDHEQKRNSVQT